MQPALQGTLNTGLMPPSSYTAHGQERHNHILSRKFLLLSSNEGRPHATGTVHCHEKQSTSTGNPPPYSPSSSSPTVCIAHS